MIPQTVLYRNMPKGDWTVVMKEEVMEVDEVVVTGLLMRKKSGFAGTTTMITKQELAKVSTGNIFTTISAIDAGFKINENNLDGSNPNVLPDFTIRGKGSFQNGSTALFLFWTVLKCLPKKFSTWMLIVSKVLPC